MNEVDLGVWPIFQPFVDIGKGLANIAMSPFKYVGKKVSPILEPGKTGAKVTKFQLLKRAQAGAELPAGFAPVLNPAGEVVDVIREPLYAGKPAVTPGPASSFTFQNLWKNLQGPLELFVKGYSSVKQAEYLSEMAKARAEAQKAAQATQQAYYEALAQQQRVEKKQKGILQTQAFKNLAPYLIPLAIGGVIIFVLATRKK